MATDDMRKELAQERVQLEADRAELVAEFTEKAKELDAREEKISRNVVILKRVTSIVRKAVDYLGDKLGLGRADEMRDAIDQLENKLDEISPTPKDGSDAFDESGPGL